MFMEYWVQPPICEYCLMDWLRRHRTTQTWLISKVYVSFIEFFELFLRWPNWNNFFPSTSHIYIFYCSLSSQTICRRINDSSAKIVRTLHDRIMKFKSYFLAFDESKDISNTSQFVILSHRKNAWTFKFERSN